jgi:hypothetical protein
VGWLKCIGTQEANSVLLGLRAVTFLDTARLSALSALCDAFPGVLLMVPSTACMPMFERVGLDEVLTLM